MARTFRGFYERDQFQEKAPMFEAAIRFRWEAAFLAVQGKFGFSGPRSNV